jgi:hypothetical protein
MIIHQFTRQTETQKMADDSKEHVPKVQSSPFPETESFELHEAGKKRLYSLVCEELMTDLLSHGAFIAGGSVVYVLNPHVPIGTVGDVDLFVRDGNQETVKYCATAIAEYWKNHNPTTDKVAEELEKHAKNENPQAGPPSSANVQKINNKIMFMKYNATLRITAPERIPIQIILCAGDEKDTISQFDIDYVQCAIVGRPIEKEHQSAEIAELTGFTGSTESKSSQTSGPKQEPIQEQTQQHTDKNNNAISFRVLRTLMARESHETKVMRYFLDYSFNMMRLESRLNKAHRKGWRLPNEVITKRTDKYGEYDVKCCSLVKIGIKIYDYGKSDFTYDIPKFDEKYTVARDYVSAIHGQEKIYSNLHDALEGNLQIFSRMEYDKNSKPIEYKQEKYVYDFTEKPTTNGEFSSVHKTQEGYKYIRIGNKNSTKTHTTRTSQDYFDLSAIQQDHHELKRFKYIARALMLVEQGKYKEACDSVRNDAQKLYTSGVIFIDGVASRSATISVKNLNESSAIKCIEIVLNSGLKL